MSGPAQVWWTAAEIAEAALPDLPGTTRGVSDLAIRSGWRDDPRYARKRAGRGGGWEYHWTLFPGRAQRALDLAAPAPAAPVRDRASAWAEYEALPDSVRAKAEARLAVLARAEQLVRGGMTRSGAMTAAARAAGVAPRTAWNWAELVEGVDAADWLAYLAPRHRSARRTVRKAGCDRDYWEFLKSAYLRLEAPTFAECHRIAARAAREAGWSALSYATAWRRMQAEVPRLTRVLARQGSAGLERCLAPQVRDRSAMVAMEGVNADCHKIDVFVRWPDGTVNRPQIVAFQDIYSGKLLSWRVDHDPNKVMVMAAFSEMVEAFGIPSRVLFDNGREFANKWMTGGAPTRFRFKVRPDDPLGVLPLMGITVHWARPGHGQAKPIERAFRDLASDLAKDPRFHGAYVGNRPDAKPENYGAAAVDHELFLSVCAEKIAEHNARGGRRSPTCAGRSFDATFAESYARAGVVRATEDQRRLWLMGQETRVLAKSHGRLQLFDNYYAAPWMAEHAGQRIVARFDPEDLHAGAHIYDPDGAYLGFAPCQVKVGFFDATEARQHRRAHRDLAKAQKALLEAERRLSPDEIAAQVQRLPGTAPAPAPEAKVVSARFGVGRPAAHAPRVAAPKVEARPRSEAEIAAQRALVDFEQERLRKQAEAAVDTPLNRFRRALALEDMLAHGRPLSDAEHRRLTDYQQLPEYHVQKEMLERFGSEVMFGPQGPGFEGSAATGRGNPGSGD